MEEDALPCLDPDTKWSNCDKLPFLFPTAFETRNRELPEPPEPPDLDKLLFNKRNIHAVQQSCVLLSLPAELIIFVLHFLDFRTLAVLPSVCRKFNNLMSDEKFWCAKLKEDFGQKMLILKTQQFAHHDVPNAGIFWRTSFRDCYRHCECHDPEWRIVDLCERLDPGIFIGLNSDDDHERFVGLVRTVFSYITDEHPMIAASSKKEREYVKGDRLLIMIITIVCFILQCDVNAENQRRDSIIKSYKGMPLASADTYKIYRNLPAAEGLYEVYYDIFEYFDLHFVPLFGIFDVDDDTIPTIVLTHRLSLADAIENAMNNVPSAVTEDNTLEAVNNRKCIESAIAFVANLRTSVQYYVSYQVMLDGVSVIDTINSLNPNHPFNLVQTD